MPTGEEGYETPKWRTVLLLIGFALLVGIGVVTVLQPEVEDEPSDEPVRWPRFASPVGRS